LYKFLTLDNENLFSLFSLNRNFALSLQRDLVPGAFASGEKGTG